MLITVKGRMIEDLNNTLTWKRGQSKEQILTSGNFVQYFFPRYRLCASMYNRRKS